jgi:hypothetical protein
VAFLPRIEKINQMKLITLSISLFVLSCGLSSRESSRQDNQKNLTHTNADAGMASTLFTDAAIQNQLVQTGSMHTARAAHTATLLKNGHVLICGGFAGNNNYIASVEIYDPASNTFRQAGNMAVPRVSHTATLLPDGKVLIAGGYDGTYLASTEIFDPVTESFRRGPDMKMARMGHTATLLNNGQILIAAGVGRAWTFLQSAEVYDIDAKSFSLTGSMHATREAHTATLLSNGTVLIVGGHSGRRSDIKIYASAEIYDSANGLFTETGNMNIKRHKHDAILLNDGSVLITGGADERDYEGIYTSTEIYHPETGIFKTNIDMNLPRFKHNGSSVLLANGKVLVAGGTDRAEIFDLQKNKFEIVAGSMKGRRFFSTVTLLQNNLVLITGGYDDNTNAGNQAWIYKQAN